VRVVDARHAEDLLRMEEGDVLVEVATTAYRSWLPAPVVGINRVLFAVTLIPARAVDR
jgi:hypothetical protein